MKWFTAAGVRTRTLSSFRHFRALCKTWQCCFNIVESRKNDTKEKGKKKLKKKSISEIYIGVAFTFKVPGKIHRGTFVSQVEIIRTKVNCEQIWLFLQMESKSINSKWKHVLKNRSAVVHFFMNCDFSVFIQVVTRRPFAAFCSTCSFRHFKMANRQKQKNTVLSQIVSEYTEKRTVYDI